MSSIRNAVGYLLVLLCVSVNFASSQEPQIAQPGAEHKMLQQLEGTWDAVVKSAEGGEESKAVATMKMGLGGLWLLSDFKGEFGGLKFEGHGLDGYDAYKKKFVSVWVDSMSGSPMAFEGTHDEKTKTLTMHGVGKGPDGKPAKYKNVTVMPDKDHQTFKMYLVGPDDKETLMMTIEYTRRK